MKEKLTNGDRLDVQRCFVVYGLKKECIYSDRTVENHLGKEHCTYVTHTKAWYYATSVANCCGST